MVQMFSIDGSPYQPLPEVVLSHIPLHQRFLLDDLAPCTVLVIPGVLAVVAFLDLCQATVLREVADIIDKIDRVIFVLQLFDRAVFTVGVNFILDHFPVPPVEPNPPLRLS